MAPGWRWCASRTILAIRLHWCMSAPMNLNLLRAFAAVHAHGSFIAAAAQLGVPRSTVSRAVAQLEEELGVALFHRTTRSVAVTAEGTALHDRVAPALAALDAAVADLPEREEEPAGTLRITATVDLGTTLLAEAVTRYLARYPRVDVDVVLSNRVLDLAREHIDLALRVAPSGRRADSALVGKRVGTVVLEVFAAPSYLARRGTPATTDDLAAHDWLTYRGAERNLVTDGKRGAPFAGRPRLTCDDMFFAREAARLGAGIAVLPTYLVGELVASGELVRVLPRFSSRLAQVWLVHPGRKHLPRRVTAFRDLVQEVLRRRPLGA
jgi:DNA-binding transcriptional LysR family regulator